MNPKTIIRAWKDPEFRAHLTSEERRALPDNPSGQPMTELDEEAMSDVVGGVPLCPPPHPQQMTRARWCINGGSAVDACPTGRGCSVIFPC